MQGLETCLYKWNKNLQDVLVQVTHGVRTTVENMRAYEFSLLQNIGPMDNQSLHHDCTSPDRLQEEDDSSIQDTHEDSEDDGDKGWRNEQLCEVGLPHGRG